MSYEMSVLSYALGAGAAFLLLRFFGSRNRWWHVLAMAAGYPMSDVAHRFLGPSVALQFSVNFATVLLLVWGLSGLLSRSQWQ
jgi:hypothetical protein